ncbi:MAG TPA: hypothetical protein PK141_18720 [Polyangiaceae bacterium]|nr:hypothetical protein [Polyangiaceae bacterium]
MRTRAMIVLAAVVLASFASLPGAALAKVRVTEPPSRSASDSLNANPPCGGVASAGAKAYPEGTTTLNVSFADGAGDTSLGCFQAVILNAAGAQLGGVFQVADDQATAARTISAPLAVPQACRGGATCTVAVRQLVNVAAGCPNPTPSEPGTGANATFYSCGDFTITQPAPRDAAPPPLPVPDAGPPSPTPSTAPTVIPLPEEDAGVRISGLRPEDAESNSCAANPRAAGWVSPVGVAGVALALALVARRRRR